MSIRPKPEPPSRYYSIDELATALRVHRRTIQAWRLKQGMPSVKQGQYRLIPLGSFIAWATEKGHPERSSVQRRLERAQAAGEVLP